MDTAMRLFDICMENGLILFFSYGIASQIPDIFHIDVAERDR